MSLHPATLFLLSVLSTCSQAQANDLVIDKTLQKTRDEDRRLILETELQVERAALAKAQGGSDPVAVHRHTENIKALGRELARVGGKPVPAPEFRHDETAPLVVRAIRAPAASMPVTSEPKPDRPAPFWDPYSRSTSTTHVSNAARRDSP